MDSKQFFQMLAFTAFVDGELQDEERPVLGALAERLGLSHQEAFDIVKEVHAQGKKYPLRIPKIPAEQQAMFQSMVEVAAADGKIMPDERSLLNKVGKRFGLTPAQVEAVIQQYLTGAQPAPAAPTLPAPSTGFSAGGPPSGPTPAAQPAAPPALDLAPEPEVKIELAPTPQPKIELLPATERPSAPSPGAQGRRGRGRGKRMIDRGGAIQASSWKLMLLGGSMMLFPALGLLLLLLGGFAALIGGQIVAVVILALYGVLLLIPMVQGWCTYSAGRCFSQASHKLDLDAQAISAGFQNLNIALWIWVAGLILGVIATGFMFLLYGAVLLQMLGR